MAAGAVCRGAGYLASLAGPGGGVTPRHFARRTRVTTVETIGGTAIAQADYGPDDLLSSLVLSDVVAATFVYNDQDRL